MPSESNESEPVVPAHEPWKAFYVRAQHRVDVKRDAVLQTAAKLYLEKGYRRTSMSELASLLNITKPALYYYFRNKEELLVECYRAGINTIESSLRMAADCEGTGLEKLRAYIESYATAVATTNFGRCVPALDDAELSSPARRQVRDLKRRIDAAIRANVEQGIRDGSIAPCNAKLAAFAIAGAINWIGTWYQPSGGLAVEEIVSEFSRLLVLGLSRRD